MYPPDVCMQGSKDILQHISHEVILMPAVDPAVAC